MSLCGPSSYRSRNVKKHEGHCKNLSFYANLAGSTPMLYVATNVPHMELQIYKIISYILRINVMTALPYNIVNGLSPGVSVVRLI